MFKQKLDRIKALRKEWIGLQGAHASFVVSNSDCQVYLTPASISADLTASNFGWLDNGFDLLHHHGENIFPAHESALEERATPRKQ